MSTVFYDQRDKHGRLGLADILLSLDRIVTELAFSN